MGYKKPAWKKQLEDAKQRNRDLDNVNHDLQVEVQRLSKALADSEAEGARIRDQIDETKLAEAEVLAKDQAARDRHLPHHRPFADVEFAMLGHLMMMDFLPETPARRALKARLLIALGIEIGEGT